LYIHENIHCNLNVKRLSGLSIINLKKETARYPEISALTYDPTRHDKNPEKRNINYGLISCVSAMYQFSRWLPSISRTVPPHHEQCHCMMKHPRRPQYEKIILFHTQTLNNGCPKWT